jgi:hypothetical protein
MTISEINGRKLPDARPCSICGSEVRRQEQYYKPAAPGCLPELSLASSYYSHDRWEEANWCCKACHDKYTKEFDKRGKRGHWWDSREGCWKDRDNQKVD